MNEQFAKLTELNPLPWDDAALLAVDAIVLMDTQPGFGNSPLPPTVQPLVVIDHHRPGRGGRAKPKCAFCEVGVIKVTRDGRKTRLECQNQSCRHFVEGRFDQDADNFEEDFVSSDVKSVKKT